MFRLEGYWVWDFWLADDGEQFHLFFLHAPKSLGNPDLRHRNARIGHATSTDLGNWTHQGLALAPGPAGAFDETATWTGSVVRGDDGRWRMFYTGSSFHSPDANSNIETVGVAVSDDLVTWHKQPGPICRADPRWYETYGTSSWPEEAWRDPWVFRDPAGNGWHMLITARANHGDDAGRGVVGHAISSDLERWEVRPPLSEPQAGFGHIEVPQVIEHNGRSMLLFCCNTPRLSGPLSGNVGGVWIAPAQSVTGPYDIGRSRLIATQALYAGRLVRDREGRWNLLAFHMDRPDGQFEGGVSDPLPLVWNDVTGLPELETPR